MIFSMLAFLLIQVTLPYFSENAKIQIFIDNTVIVASYNETPENPKRHRQIDEKIKEFFVKKNIGGEIQEFRQKI